jgi:hypothetical protein
MSKEVKRYNPLLGLARNAKLRRMDMQCDPQWVLDLAAERDALLAERDAFAKDAERYRWLRMADWWNSPLCVIRDPKQQAKPGTDCPSRDRLDEAIDAALQGAQP